MPRFAHGGHAGPCLLERATMKMRFVGLSVGFAMVVGASAQITFGQVDTFNSDVMNWNGASPTWQSSGGNPGGFLRLQSGPGFSQKMAGKNSTQWLGNYTAAGV